MPGCIASGVGLAHHMDIGVRGAPRHLADTEEEVSIVVLQKKGSGEYATSEAKPIYSRPARILSLEDTTEGKGRA